MDRDLRNEPHRKTLANKTESPIIVHLLEHTRLRPEQHDPPFHYYQARHSEGDWSIPETIEEGNVYCNFWGTVVTLGKVDFVDGVYELTNTDQNLIIKSLAGQTLANSTITLNGTQEA